MKHVMGLQKSYFMAISNGTKKYELRLNDEKRKIIHKNDIITFLMEPDRIDSVDTIVTDLIYFDSFQDVLDKINIKLLAPNKSREGLLDDLNRYYSIDKQKKYGVVAIEVSSDLIKEKSCGVITYKKINNQKYYLLVHHNVGHWGFPKGHVENDETEEETAIREVKEETNIDVRIKPGFREIITYSHKNGVIKDVVFFLGIAVSDEPHNQESEISEARWVEEDKVLDLITHDDEKELFKIALNYMNGCDSNDN